ncbi:hypothetical protein RF679_13530 [Undibacterium cyanobacteriorum]|uniref:DUF4337 domain-containing protein n=1 Tax=Undibacterium cyanobacteriorum TaxID=3073561 RepID=A0ABY9REL9_9BURK|nr:hypothetical protein [Undibacterium sp. 20NA77.5]WMW79667.1 hypothetical protein RF679_13530 [Undibacterium sp. 20NA77.5]
MTHKTLTQIFLLLVCLCSSIAGFAQSDEEIKEDLRNFPKEASCQEIKARDSQAGKECEKDSQEMLDMADVSESKSHMQAMKKIAAQQKLLEAGRSRSQKKDRTQEAPSLSPSQEAEQNQRERRMWLKIGAAALLFGALAKWKGASFTRWGLVGAFTCGTLILAGYLPN